MEPTRPTATPARTMTWLRELLRVPDGLLDAVGPFPTGVSPRTREQMVLAVADVNGCRMTTWIHTAWLDFLGQDDSDDMLQILVHFASDSALAGEPLEANHLSEHLDPRELRGARATVALAELSSLFGNSIDSFVGRLTRSGAIDPKGAIGDAVAFACGVPAMTPFLALGSAMRLANRAAPPLPRIVSPTDDDANLVVHMLSTALPYYLSNALVRTFVLRLPSPLLFGVRAEGSEATVRIARDQISVANGIDPRALLIVDGPLELLLHVATRTLAREASNSALGRNS